MRPPALDVTSRIAMLESRFGSLRARTGGSGPGGVVGAAMAQSLTQASAAAGVTLPGITDQVSLSGAAVPTASAASTPAGGPSGAWAQNLPAAGAPWAAAIEEAAERNGVEPELLGALVWTESYFDPEARSPSGAIGLGQLMPATAAGMNVDPTNPEQNLDGAARYLREQLDRFGDTKLALAAYNAGPGRVARAGGVPNITETRNYVDRVTARAATLGGR